MDCIAKPPLPSSHHTLTKPKWSESYTDGVISYLDEIVFESSTTISCTQHNKLISYRFLKAENFQTCESLVAPKHHGNFNFGKIFLSLHIFKAPSTLLVLFYPVFLIINSFCSTFFETFTFLIRKHVAKSANISKTARRVRRWVSLQLHFSTKIIQSKLDLQWCGFCG